MPIHHSAKAAGRLQGRRRVLVAGRGPVLHLALDVAAPVDAAAERGLLHHLELAEVAPQDALDAGRVVGLAGEDVNERLASAL